MLAAADTSDAEMLTFIITNLFSQSGSTRLTVTLPADATLQALHEKVAEECQYVPGTFELRSKDDTVFRLGEDPRASVAADDPPALIHFFLANKARLTLGGVNGNEPVSSGGLNSSTAAAALGTVAMWSSTRGETVHFGPLNRHGGYGGSGSAEPNADGFVGLVNQGATCYLSSVLQALFMTPEFRRALYDAGAAEAAALAAAGHSASAAADGGIVRQLQRLFVALQTSGAQAIDTKQLTHSFGWDASGAPHTPRRAQDRATAPPCHASPSDGCCSRTVADAFTQHDVQELLRVLFDALEAELEHTSVAGALERMYRGTWSDYVQCKECRHQSSNPSSFDDINLAIRAFDAAQTPFTSLPAALSAFLEPETLDGDNAYYCEACACKRPALKGTRLVTLPPILCVGLKRFDFDFATLTRIKLYHKVAVPPMLDMAPFLDGGAVARQHSSTKRKLIGSTTPNATPQAAPVDDAQMAEAVPPLPQLPPSLVAPSEPDTSAGDSATAAAATQPAGALEAMSVDDPVGTSTSSAAPSPYSSAVAPYELFSLLMHSGSALSGHYFAYIKELHSGKWYKFNDSDVTVASADELEKAMGVGGERGSGPSTYMSFYRRVDDASRAAAAAQAEAAAAPAGEELSPLRVPVPPALKELLDAAPAAVAVSLVGDATPTAPTNANSTAPSDGASFIGPIAPPSSPSSSGAPRAFSSSANDDVGEGRARALLSTAFGALKENMPPSDEGEMDTATATGAAAPVQATSSESTSTDGTADSAAGAAGAADAAPSTGTATSSCATPTPSKPAPRPERGITIGRRPPPSS